MTASASPSVDPLAALDERARQTLTKVAELLIPAAHDMPSAGQVVGDDRLRFVLTARPDLVEPLLAALRSELGDDPRARIDGLAGEEPAVLGALQLVIVAGYYTDRRVRELIGYPGQLAIEVKSWLYPAYLEEGLIDAVLARGPVWRDPATGRKAVTPGAPRSYEERAWASGSQGGNDGSDGS